MSFVSGPRRVAAGSTFLRAIQVYSFRNRVAMDAKGMGRVSDALLVSGECFFDIKLFKFFQGFAQHDVAIKHFLDYSFQSGSYLHLSLESAPKAS